MRTGRERQHAQLDVGSVAGVEEVLQLPVEHGPTAHLAVQHRLVDGAPALFGATSRDVWYTSSRVGNYQQAEIYGQFGLDPERVIADIVQRRKERDPTRRFKGETNVFRVLIKTLLNAGLITDRTRGFYAMYIDMDELQAEGTRMVGDDIAEEGIRYLQAINFKDQGRTVSIAAE